MGGEFSFVPGSLEVPAGPDFDVSCPTFRMDMPPVIF